MILYDVSYRVNVLVMAESTESHEGFYGMLNRLFDPIDKLLGPNRSKHKESCVEDKDIFLECVLKS